MTQREPAPAIDAVRRAVDIEQGDEAAHVTVSLTTNLSQAPVQLWPRLTDPAELAKWYGPVQGDLREGGSFAAPGGAHGRVLEAAAPHQLSLTWEYGNSVDALEIRLDPEDDGTTELELTHTSDLAPEVFEEFGPGAIAVGWEIALMGLAAYTDGWHHTCQGDVPVPGPLWLASGQAAEYVRGWSIRWAAASIAAGTDEELARRGEAATARAYGGAPADAEV